MRETAIVRDLMRAVDARLGQWRTVKVGKITAISAGPPPTVTVVGQQMRYLDSLSTPAVGDTVAYLASERLVIGRRA